MGYTTNFEGLFEIDKPLTPEHRRYLLAFAGTRRMKRSERRLSSELALMRVSDPLREAVGLPMGDDCGYTVTNAKFTEDRGVEIAECGQVETRDIDDYNGPPEGQPGLWCQWEPNEDGTAIHHDQGEKFYHYVEWLKYLIHHFLAPWGYVLNGSVEWDGEEQGDVGRITVKANEVTVKKGRIVYDD